MGGKSGKQVPFWDGTLPETPKFVKERKNDGAALLSSS
jgi:hypothetical protein